MPAPAHQRALHVPATVLVIESYAVIATARETMHSDLGVARIRIAASRHIAFELIDRLHFDLAILDLDLGGRDSKLIAAGLSAAGIPAILSTGESGFPQLPGAVRVLRKPYVEEDLRLLRTEMCASATAPGRSPQRA